MTFSLTIKTSQDLADEALAQAKEAATGAVQAVLKGAYDAFIAKYPAGEVVTWAHQEQAARAYLATTATAEQTAFLQVRADLTGETLTDLSNMIVAKADLFAATGMTLAGIRAKAEAAIDAATTAAEAQAAVTAAQADVATVLGG